MSSDRVEDPAPAHPRICVIGAGPSGLTTLKNLRQAGLTNLVCYEASDTIGGNWAYSEEQGHSSVYASTFLISSKKLSQFEDYPMPDCYPDFCSHTQVLSYFESYARHFNVLPFIRFRTKVCHAWREADAGWRIRVAGPEGDSDERYDVLLVCTGHHFEPVVPSYPGEFSEAMLHSHAFKTATPFRGQRVLVVGAGNSACDVAVDVSRVAARTALSMRHGQHIIPKIAFGLPTDVIYRRLRHIPKPIRRFVLEKGLRLVIGRWERYGLQPPARPLMEMHPTLSTDVLLQIRHGRVIPRRGIERFDGKTVVFVDNRKEDFDTVIWATGYRTVFPFFDRSFVDWREARRLPLSRCRLEGSGALLVTRPVGEDGPVPGTHHFMGMKQNSLTLPFPDIRLESVVLIDGVWVVGRKSRALQRLAHDVRSPRRPGAARINGDFGICLSRADP